MGKTITTIMLIWNCSSAFSKAYFECFDKHSKTIVVKQEISEFNSQTDTHTFNDSYTWDYKYQVSYNLDFHSLEIVQVDYRQTQIMSAGENILAPSEVSDIDENYACRVSLNTTH
jgi:hypothetical protein